MSKNKTTIEILILTMLVGIALIPAVSAATVNANSDIMNNIGLTRLKHSSVSHIKIPPSI